MYEAVVPLFKPAWPMAKCDFVCVKGRKEFFMTSWTKNNAELKSTKLFQIGGETSKSISEEVLKFKEIYFQFFVMLDKFNYYAFQLTDEAFIEQGYLLKFDNGMKFKESIEIAKMPQRCMRPTIVPIKKDGEKQLVFIGGFEQRHNLHYSPKENKWNWFSRIPEGHNITTTVCCNFKDEAIFTFMTDA